jgi:hypothetical protein
MNSTFLRVHELDIDLSTLPFSPQRTEHVRVQFIDPFGAALLSVLDVNLSGACASSDCRCGDSIASNPPVVLPGENGEHVWWGPNAPGCCDDAARAFHTALREAGELCGSVFSDRLRESVDVEGALMLGINLYIDDTLVTYVCQPLLVPRWSGQCTRRCCMASVFALTALGVAALAACGRHGKLNAGPRTASAPCTCAC